MSPSLFKAEQIAPCGMNCGVCSAYLAFSHNIPKERGKIWHCSGCRVRGKKCAYIKGQCKLLSAGKVTFCYECPDFPCKRLENIDRRYQRVYGISFIRNLEEIRDRGLASFLHTQSKIFLCRKCKMDALSVHNRKCYQCDTITNWRTTPEKNCRHGSPNKLKIGALTLDKRR